MGARMKPILGALVTAYVIFYLGVTYALGPALADAAPAEPMMAGWLSLAISAILLIIFYDWVNQAVKNPLRSAMIVAISQFLVLDVYYVLNGTRGVSAGAISAALLFVAWGAVGLVYGKLSEEASA